MVAAGNTTLASFPLNYNTPESNLSRKFLIAIKQGGRMVQVSDEHYITNPEAVALYTTPRMNVGIKGILPDAARLYGTDYAELGIQQIAYNMSIDSICSSAGVPGAIPFVYNGQTYYFDLLNMFMYDTVVQTFNKQGIAVNMVLLNQGTGAYSRHLVHPMAKGASCPGYALNVTTDQAVEHLKAIAAFLGQRYSGKLGCGQVDNWVKNDLTTPYITMQNLDLLIAYMHHPVFLNPAGQVRSISLSEIGFTSSFGNEAQEASVAYGYLKAASLPDVDAFILFRQTDDLHEMQSYLAMGLLDPVGNKKPAYYIYKNLGTANEGSARARASQIIGMDITKLINEKIILTRPGSGIVVR